MRQLAMYSTILAAVPTATTGIDAATGGSSADVADTEAEGELGDPGLPNVYHVVLDMFQTEMFETQLDDQTRNDLGGFTYFPDTRTEWGRTHLSMSSLYSTDDWDYEQPLDLRMAATYTGDTSAVTKLEEAGYQTTGWIHSTSFYGDQTPFDVMHHHRRPTGRCSRIGQAQAGLDALDLQPAPAYARAVSCSRRRRSPCSRTTPSSPIRTPPRRH